VSKDPPAHTRKRGAGSDGDDEQPAGLAALGPVSVADALRRLPPPKHSTDFWTDLDDRLADEPQLRLAPRSAIRPITQPPPVIDDSNLATALKGDGTPPRRSSRRGALVMAIVVLLAGLGVVAALQDPDDPSGGDTDTATDTSGGRTPTSDGDAAPTTAPTTSVPAGTIDPATPLTPAGVGPLTIGARMADLQAAGLTIESDNELFEGSGGTCWVARVAGALDLELRFRAPEDQGGVEDPTEGVLAAISIESGLPTVRTSNSRIGLGAPQDQVLAAYGGNLDDRAHPFVAGGHIFRADAGNGTGIAFQTDGLSVIGVVVGEMDAIRFINECG
jgi:hypothetical protein